MVKYIILRLIYSVISLWFIITLTFILVHMLPGDPFASAKAMPASIKAEMFKKYGLNKPVVTQYFIYLGNLLQGDLGMSMRERGRTVVGIIATHFPYSFNIGIKACIFGAVFGVIMGIIAGLYRAQVWDTLSLLIAIIGVSVPSFILAGLFQYIVVAIGQSTGYNILPVAGFGGFDSTILPSIALGMFPVALVARLMRASLIEVLGQDYIKTAKAKGVSTTSMIVKHAIRNAIMPVITFMGPMVAFVLTGSFVIEKMFAIPGIGKYYVDCIFNDDYTVIMGLTIFFAVLLIGVIFLVDLSYSFIDPRIKVQSGKGE